MLFDGWVGMRLQLDVWGRSSGNETTQGSIAVLGQGRLQVLCLRVCWLAN
jgi:hypothetical protein